MVRLTRIKKGANTSTNTSANTKKKAFSDY